MTDEAAESRRPATTEAGSSQDAPAPSAVPAPPSTAPGMPSAEERTTPAAPSAPAAPAAPVDALGNEPTAQFGGETAAQFGGEPTAQASDEPTVSLAGEPTVDTPQAWTPPAADAPPADDPLPPPTGAGDPPPSDAGDPPPAEPPGAGNPPPGAPPPWFGEGGPTFSRERLVRPSQGRYVAGVCAAIGRATNTDPVLWRVLLVVLGLFGGVGVLIYLVGWLSIQGEGDAVSPIESLLGRGRSTMAPLSVILLGAAAVVTFAFIVHDGFRALLLGSAVLVGIAMLIRRNSAAARPVPDPAPGSGPGAAAAPTGSGAAFPFRPMDRTTAFAAASAPAAPPAAAPSTGGPSAATAPASEPVTAPLPPRPPGYEPPRFPSPPAGDYRPPFAPHGPYAGGQVSAPPAPPPKPPKPPKPPRERSKLGRITFFAVLMVLGVLALVDLAAASVPVSAYFAAALATIGLGLLVGAWFGRARGLIALALLAALGLGVSSGVERFGGQVANSNYQPQNISEVADRYDFNFGNAVINLRAVNFTDQQQPVTVSMNVGQVKVLLPDNVNTTVAVRMETGRALLFGQEYDGDSATPITITDQGADGAGGGTLNLTIQMKAGNVEVAR